MIDHSAHPATSTAVTEAEVFLAQMGRLVQYYREGVLSEEEFREAKAHLLNMPCATLIDEEPICIPLD